MNSATILYENPYATFSISDGILFCIYKPNVVITFNVAHLVVADRLRFQKEKAYPVLCDIRGVIGTEKAGRDYLAQYGSSLTSAVAIWVNPTVLNTISSFYVSINKPNTPTMLFTSQKKALQYLHHFR